MQISIISEIFASTHRKPPQDFYFWISLFPYVWTALYRVAPQKTGTVDFFLGFALINIFLFSPCWIEHLVLIMITPRSSNLVKNFLFHEQFLMDCHFRDLLLICHWWVPPPQKKKKKKKNTEQSIFLELCSDQQLSFFTLLTRVSFSHYNNTKIIKFGWKLYMLWVISYGLSFSGFAINLSSCLGTLEIGQIPKTTVHKKLLIKLKVLNQIWWSWCYYNGDKMLYPARWKRIIVD